MTRNTCKACNGTGHTKKTRPEVSFEWGKDEKTGEERRFHVTKSQGSGCPLCHGVGYKDAS